MRLQVNDWMENLIYEDADELYRFKGVLAIEDWPDRFIFQVSLMPCLSSTHPSQLPLSVPPYPTCRIMCEVSKDITGILHLHLDQVLNSPRRRVA